MPPKRTLRRILMESLGFFLTVFLLSFLINAWRAPRQTEQTLPRLRGTTLQGTPLQKLVKPGKPFMIHFWGIWCPVCTREVSNIAFVSRRYPVLTVAVNSGSSDTIRRWMRKKGFRYPVLNDPVGALARDFGVTVYPTTFIYDPSGALRFVESGYTTTAGLLTRMKLAE